ncbi:mitochondrial 40s ribosomal protein [Cylindrobasidium torrendii FP15055 ss-10]|uniref:Mitochondrial 40s ribosomal protein n=1 Tax=Cylindrobasidium torrendii FP15055 ss-10 TaxID=1314674 RepID=A0A0D7BTI3_9AGAR|nr:mitochondrial 40s ribosomal protein [Cylindrobasidium torrendii FP15055 ss-10]
MPPPQYGWINARVLRDMKRRKGVQEAEVMRRAYLLVARNQTLPAQVRHQAQLQLNGYDRYARPAEVKNRCTATGRGRGVMSEFGLCRYQFRLKALAGEINGVSRVTW